MTKGKVTRKRSGEYSRVAGKTIIYVHIDKELASDVRKLAKSKHYTLSHVVEEFIGYGIANKLLDK